MIDEILDRIKDMRLIAIGFAGLALIACTEDGYKGLPPLINGTSVGSGINYVDKGPDAANWKYGDVKNDDGIFSTNATVYAINEYKSPNYENLLFKPFMILTTRDYSDVKKDVDIYALQPLACTPSCKVKFNINGYTKIYTMIPAIDSVLTPQSVLDKETLFSEITKANKATVWLPIAGLGQPFAAEFNLRGYDAKKMKLSSELD